jgi:hypothetical protein
MDKETEKLLDDWFEATKRRMHLEVMLEFAKERENDLMRQAQRLGDNPHPLPPERMH